MSSSHSAFTAINPVSPVSGLSHEALPPQGMITQMEAQPHGSGLGMLILPKGQQIQVLPTQMQPREIPKPPKQPSMPVQPMQVQVTQAPTPKTALEVVIQEIDAEKTEWYENGHAKQEHEQEKKKKKKSNKRVCIKVSPKLFFAKKHVPYFFQQRKRNYQLPRKTLLEKFKKYLLWGRSKKK